MSKIVITSAKRTPIGKFLGGLSSLSAPELGKYAVNAVIQDSKLKKNDVDEKLQEINGNVIFELTITKFLWKKGGSKQSRIGDLHINDDGALCVNGVDEFISRFCEPSQCPEKGQDLCMKYELNESSDELTIYYPDDGGRFEVETYQKRKLK